MSKIFVAIACDPNVYELSDQYGNVEQVVDAIQREEPIAAKAGRIIAPAFITSVWPEHRKL